MPFKRNYRNPILEEKTIDNLPSFIKDNARRYSSLPIYSYFINSKEIRSISYAEFYEHILSIGAFFKKNNLAGKNIVIIGSGHPAYMEFYNATVFSGGIIFPIDKDLTDEELVKFIKKSKASAVCYTPSECERFDSLVSLLENVEYFISVSDDYSKDSGRIIGYNDVLESGKTESYEFERFAFDNVDVEKCCTVIFTSGTTGTSKGIMLSQKNICYTAMAAADYICFLHEGLRLVSVLPMNHTYEVTCSHFTSQYFGTHTLLNNSLKYVMRNFKSFKPEFLVLVPLFLETMYKKINEELKAKGMLNKVNNAVKMSNALLKLGIDVRGKLFKQINDAFGGNLNGIVCGGAPLSKEITEFFIGIGIDVVEGYGITECSPLVSVNHLNHIVPGSVGVAVKGCEVKTDNGNFQGEILVKGPNVMLGYYEDEEATKDVFTNDGFFKTGDIGSIDKNGNIRLSGRKKNIIILSNGKNIYPEEIEEYLYKINGVKECAVIGRSNKIGEKVITALIYPDVEIFKNMPSEEIKDYFNEKIKEINSLLPNYKHINLIEIRNEEFEKTTTHKIKRYILK